MANDTLGLNIVFPIYNADGTSFHDITMKKSAFSGTTMSLNDKVSGEFLFKDSSLTFTQKEYIVYNGVHYCMDNPPTLVKEGIVGDNSELKGMSKYSVEFLHPMCHLADIPFLDVAVSDDEVQYLSDRKKFSWIGKPADFVAKLNKNLQHTEWCVVLSDRFPNEKLNERSEVLNFENSMISDALQKWYETWKLPFIIDVVENTEAVYSQGKRFKIVLGLASNEIYATDSDRQTNNPFVFQMGQGVGLKNNSRTPRNNKIVTRISGYGSEKNIPYGYPQVRWFGTAGQSYTYGDNVGVYENVTIGGHTFAKVISYPIYKGILNGAYVELIQHPFTRSNLMPSVYRQTLFNKISFINEDGTPNTDYDPDIELVDYYDAIYSEEHQYPNPINPLSPSYEVHEFDKIKPELGEANILSATPLNNDLTVANEWVDDIDENGEFEQNFFKVKLPILAFDLYACASITEEMEINMRSGRCLGCTFPVQIDWDDYKVNFYDSEGNFAPNGAQRNLDKYPKSNLGSIEVILKKENSTFGTVMPNKYQYPIGESEEGANDGDSFVILGISLPESYILNAEERLDADMKSYMLENNVYYFDYPLKFDEFFLRNNTNILRQIKQNTIIRFRFNNQELSLSVKELSIKYGDSVLPQYSITLTDNVEVSVNSIGQVADDVDKLSSMLSILRESYSKNVWVELSNKLSKTQDDTAKGLISFLKGLQIGKNFVGGTFGEGAQFVKDENGKTYLELDRLYVRLKAYFDNVEIRDSQHTKGNRYGTNAGCKCIAVDAFDSNGEVTTNANEVAKYRCYFRGTDNDNTITNDFVVGDLAYCHVSNVVSDSELYQHNYWRLVIGKSSDVDANGNHYIDLSNETSNTIDGVEYSGYMANSDKPLAQDDIIQLGNVNDATRRGAVAEYVSGIDTPSYQIFQSLGSIGSATTIAEKQAAQFSFEGKNVINLGYSSTQGRAFMKVYGDAYIGDANKNAYIEFKQVGANNRPELNIKAKIDASSTIGDQTWNEYLENNQNALEELQSQIDGEIDTWFENIDPSPLVSPEKEWIEIDTESGNNNERLKHLGDVYYNNQTGYAWRYTNKGTSETPVFTWVEISDSAVTKALTTVNAIVSNYGNVLNIQSPTAEGVGQALGFLRQVLGGNVTADGGLVLAHMIALKDSNDNIMSGINGTLDTTLVDSLHTPAAWYGGAMVDYEALNNIQKAQGWNTWKWARSLFRFDGSGYLADGNISWNKEGLMTIRDLETIITNNNNTVALNDVSTLTNVFHTHVADNVVYIYPQNNFCNIRVSRTLSRYTINDYDVLNRGEMDARYVRTEFFNKIFRPYKLVNNQQTMVSVNDTSIIDGSALLDNLKILVGTWTDSYLSALGQNPNSGGGGASYNRLDSWASYDASKAGWVLSALLGNDLNSRVTSLENGQIEGVATQEWVQQQGYLTELSAATINALGAIKIGYSANGKNYPVLLDNNNRAYVSVPWSDTTYGVFGASDNGLVPMASASNKIEAEAAVGNYYLCADGKFRQLPANAFKNDNTWTAWKGATSTAAGTAGYMPAPTSAQRSQFLRGDGTWVDLNNYSLPAATSGALGGIKVGYTTSGKNYKVQLDSNNNAYVNVPWSDTTYTLPTASADTLGGVKVGSTLAIASGVLNLPTTGVTAGTYKRVTVDAYGRVTSGDNTDTDTNTWRNIYVGGTSKVGTGIDTKAINFKAGSNVSLSFAVAGTGSGQSGNVNYFDVVISATDTTYSAATQSAAGLMSAADKKKLDGIAEGANKYSLPLAASGTRGGIQLGYTQSGKNYPVQLSGEKAYVNVPWENTTYSAGTGISLSGTTFSNSGVRATTINGNYLRVNTNGTNADLTIPYATNADKLDGYHAADMWIKNPYFNHDLATLTTSPIHGTFAIKLPNKWTNSMNTYVIQVSEYGVAEATVTVYFYNYQDGVHFINQCFRVDGEYTKGVRLAYDANNIYILLGNSNTSWNYTNIYLKEVLSGWANIDKWGSGYSISRVTDESIFEQIVSVPQKSQTTSITGNAATSTTLATPRTIWGQSFDGSANVSGAMSGVTSVDGLLYFDTTTGYVKISGSSPSPLVLNSTSTYNYLYFRVNDSNKANIGWYSDNLGLIMQCGSNFVSLASTGDLKKNGSYKFWHEGNDGSGSGLDADMVDGEHLSSWTFPHSPRDFKDGTLIKTSIDYSKAEGDAFFMEIAGDTYTYGLGSMLTLVQGYIYNNTIISYSVNNLGRTKITELYAMNIDGNLCFWFPRLGYWQSFRVGVYRSSGGNYWKNVVTSITNSAKPTGTKEVSLHNTLYTNAYVDSNVASATKLQTARTINGTSFDGSANITTANWGTARNISIADSDSTNTGSAVSVNGSAAVTLKLPATIKATLSGNAASATKLATARTIWGQSFDGSANVSGAMTGVTNVDSLLYFDTVNGNGRVGIGTSTPDFPLSVYGNIATHFWVDSRAIVINDPRQTAGYQKIEFNRGGAEDFGGIHWFHDRFGGYSFNINCVNIVANNGYVTLGAWNAPALLVTPTDNVGIGTTSPNYKLDVAGVIHSSTGMFSDGYVSALGQNTSSDERLKDIKGDIDLSVGLYADAPMVSFEWTKNKSLGAQVGTIAQYWQKTLPQVVHDRGDGYLSMQYDVAALLGTITIAKRVQNHEERIKELERENEALREQLKELKG